MTETLSVRCGACGAVARLTPPDTQGWSWDTLIGWRCPKDQPNYLPYAEEEG